MVAWWIVAFLPSEYPIVVARKKAENRGFVDEQTNNIMKKKSYTR